MEDSMKKIGFVKESDILSLKEADDKVAVAKRILGIDSGAKYSVGDTAISVECPEKLAIYKNTSCEKDFFYIAVEILGDNLVFAYSVYPI